eukprot:7740693-Heterocapsa_arctica.AAC.1
MCNRWARWSAGQCGTVPRPCCSQPGNSGTKYQHGWDQHRLLTLRRALAAAAAASGFFLDL